MFYRHPTKEDLQAERDFLEHLRVFLLKGRFTADGRQMSLRTPAPPLERIPDHVDRDKGLF
jgi:hypothetical protein